MVGRNRGRYLAPIAILVVIVAAILIVQGDVGSKHHASPARANNLSKLFNKPVKRPTSYIVKSGDSLSAISVRTGVPVPTLESLNPAVDPNALQTGQRLRLR